MLFRIFKKFRYACRGLLFVLKHELSFRVELLLAVVTLLVASFMGLPPLGWAVILLAIGMVLGAELFNTVAEKLLDLAEPRLSVHVAQLKDILAGAVTIFILMALGVACTIVISQF